MRGSSPPGGARGGRRRRTGRGHPPGGGRGHDAAAVSGSRGGGAELSGQRCGALGRGGAELGTTAARRIDGAEVAKCWKRGRGEEIYGGAFCPGGSHHPGQKAPPFVPGESTTRDKRAFCPGSRLHTGQKVFLGGPGKFPARGPPLVPGGSTTRDKRRPFSLVPTKFYVCFCFFLLLF